MTCPLVLEKEIGSGAFGTVYLVNTEIGPQALKIHNYSHLGHNKLISNSYLENLEEIDIMSRLRHPNLMASNGIIIPGDCPEIIPDTSIGLLMPLAKGNLYQIYLEQIINKEAKKDIMFQMVSALKFLHDNHYLHLDLKLENILWDGDIKSPRILLTDFGLARYVDDIKKGFYSNEQYITINYRPFENFGRCSIWNEKSDVWSLGIIFLELMGAQPFTFLPWTEANMLAILSNKLLKQREKTLDSIAANSIQPLLFKQLLSGMLAINPAERFNMEQVIKHPFFNDFISPVGYSINLPPITKTYSEEQLNAIRTTLLSIPKKIPLSCYFLAMDLMFRISALIESKYEDYCIVALSIAYLFYDRRTLIPNLDKLILNQRMVLSLLKGILYRSYIFEAAKSIEQLDILHRFMPQVIQQYLHLDLDSIFNIFIPTTEQGKSKYVTVGESAFRDGPGF